MMSVNATIKKAKNKGGNDEVLVTMYKDSDNKLTTKYQILECFSDADVLKKFKSMEEQKRKKIVDTILSETDEEGQERNILTYIKKLS